MVRAPCCDKMGLKKGPWTADEDRTLVAYISSYGHGNWRALPKQAGLSRCGKSCRLRWTNYLRPDIKRGDFSREEEEMIASLHEKLGNRWSAIAARLPGRTDNEIKNVWHTHIKKRLTKQNHHEQSVPSRSSRGRRKVVKMTKKKADHPMSPECVASSSQETFDMDESFRSETLSTENSAEDQLGATLPKDQEDGGMDFWLSILMEAGDLEDLPEI